MNGQILRLGGDEHDIVQLLLPWFDSGRLDAAETARVQAHLGGCARCQADVTWQRRVRSLATRDADATTRDEASPDVDRGWATLRARVTARDAPRVAASAPKPTLPARRRWAFGWGWLVAFQSALIAGLGALVLVMPRPDSYHALGQPAHGGAADASVVVVFKDDASQAQVRQALRDSDARIVDGPTVTGAYLLGVAADRQADALARLRASPSVLRVDALATQR